MLLFVACGQPNPDKKEQANAEELHEESNMVAVSNEQMRTVGIEVGAIEMKNLTNSISVNGTLAVPNQNKAFATSLAGGVLSQLNVQPGAFVKKGQVIGTIVNTELSGVQQQFVSINAQIKFNEQELKRQQELVQGNAAPFKNVQKIEAELSGLKAQQSALRKQLSALGASSSGNISSTLSIVTPISGTVSEIQAQIGSKIDANSPIAEITNNSELHLDLFVYEKDLPKVAKGQTIHFTLTNNPGKEYDAIVYSIGTAFINDSKAIPVHAKVINDKTGLIEGMSVTARISLGTNVYPAVPDDAIVNNGGKDFIFIVSKKSSAENESNGTGQRDTTITFERVQIIRGASDVGYTEIKSTANIPTEVKIATKGSFFLMAKMTNTGDHD